MREWETDDDDGDGDYENGHEGKAPGRMVHGDTGRGLGPEQDGDPAPKLERPRFLSNYLPSFRFYRHLLCCAASQPGTKYGILLLVGLRQVRSLGRHIDWPGTRGSNLPSKAWNIALELNGNTQKRNKAGLAR